MFGLLLDDWFKCTEEDDDDDDEEEGEERKEEEGGNEGGVEGGECEAGADKDNEIVQAKKDLVKNDIDGKCKNKGKDKDKGNDDAGEGEGDGADLSQSASPTQRKTPMMIPLLLSPRKPQKKKQGLLGLCRWVTRPPSPL